MMDAMLDELWAFVLGRRKAPAFEAWCYATTDLEGLLGSDFYLDVVATPFGDPARVDALRRELYAWLERRGFLVCLCPTWGDFHKQAMVEGWTGQEVEARLELLRARTPWLSLCRCRRCGQAWYVACDTRDDDWYFKRLSEAEARSAADGAWPRDFDGHKQYGL